MVLTLEGVGDNTGVAPIFRKRCRHTICDPAAGCPAKTDQVGWVQKTRVPTPLLSLSLLCDSRKSSPLSELVSPALQHGVGEKPLRPLLVLI